MMAILPSVSYCTRLSVMLHLLVVHRQQQCVYDCATAACRHQLIDKGRRRGSWCRTPAGPGKPPCRHQPRPAQDSVGCWALAFWLCMHCSATTGAADLPQAIDVTSTTETGPVDARKGVGSMWRMDPAGRPVRMSLRIAGVARNRIPKE